MKIVPMARTRDAVNVFPLNLRVWPVNVCPSINYATEQKIVKMDQTSWGVVSKLDVFLSSKLQSTFSEYRLYILM